MSVFKTYFKIVNRHKYMIFLMLVISIAITFFFATSDSNTSISDINPSKIKVSYIKRKDNAKNNALVKYLDKTFTLSKIDDNENTIKDSLYYQSAHYVVILDDKVVDYQIPNTSTGFIVENYINSFLNTYQSFESTGNYNVEKLAELTLKNLDQKVKIESPNKLSSEYSVMSRYFSMYVYGLIGAIIMGIGCVINALDKKPILKRTLASSYSLRKRNLYILLGHICLGIFSWSILAIVSILMFTETAFSNQHSMMLLNSFIFLLPIIALAFMISQFVDNYTVLSGLNNVITLGLSFISGAFIPQILLNDVVLKVASFFPAYWFVLANDKISELTTFDLSAISQSLLIQIGFAIMFVCIGLAVSRVKQSKTSF